jgi:hypothetical protein
MAEAPAGVGTVFVPTSAQPLPSDPYPVTLNILQPEPVGLGSTEPVGIGTTENQYEYIRRYTTLEGPKDVNRLVVDKLWVKKYEVANKIYVLQYEIIGGGGEGENVIPGLTDYRLQVFGKSYFSDRVSIAGIYSDDPGGLCPVPGDAKLYVNGNTLIEQNLVVLGDCCIEGTLTKGSGTFDINHPLEEEKRLRHSFIEGPRYDNIYRNKVRLTKGKATVNLDTDCVSPGGQTMTPGTWEKLNRNPDIFLQNLEGWSRLKGKINGSILEIECEDENCMDLVSWMVIAERQDEHVINSEMSDDQGRLILEYGA